MAKRTTVKPTYMKGKRPLRIALHDVVRFVKMLDQKKHTKKFQTAAKRNKAYVKVHADTVNFVKDYVAKNKLHTHPIGKHIVNARAMMAASDPYDCNFGQGH